MTKIPLDEFRISRHMTQAQVAEWLGIRQASVSEMLRNPKRLILVTLSRGRPVEVTEVRTLWHKKAPAQKGNNA